MALPVGYEAQIRTSAAVSALKHGITVLNTPDTSMPITVAR